MLPNFALVNLTIHIVDLGKHLSETQKCLKNRSELGFWPVLYVFVK
jgi:hypothetical protein